MSELEQRLGALLSNPQLMQQIASMAQAMGAAPPEEPPPSPAAGPNPGLTEALARSLHSGGNPDQKALLQALSPFLSSQRLRKLERAMEAARLAGAASAFLSAGGLQLLTGR